MSAVTILHGGKPNRLASAANLVDLPWFASNAERHHNVRRPIAIEWRQALCMHGRAPAGHDWCVAAKLIGQGLVARRFFALWIHAPLAASEEAAEEAFDQALIAGLRPET